MNASIDPAAGASDRAADVRYALQRFAVGVATMRAQAARLEVEELREYAWYLLHPVFGAWAEYEAGCATRLDSAEIVDLRLAYRLQPELAPFRFANFPDASRLLRKEYADASALEREDERNPGAPPAMHCVYERAPRARGAFDERDRTVIEALDHAALRIPCVDVVHQRTAAACEALLPGLVRAIAAGRDFFLLDVACGGNRLGRALRDRLRDAGVTDADLGRVHVLGVDVDSRAAAYTFVDGGLPAAWCARTAHDVDVEIVRGNLFDARTEDAIRTYLRRAGRDGFDAVTALGVFDYFDCPLPDEPRVYVPGTLAAPLAQKMRAYCVPRGLAIAAVFAAEDPDPVSTGARHLFANWHIKHASREDFRRWFSFASPGEITGIPGVDTLSARRAHFVVHAVP